MTRITLRLPDELHRRLRAVSQEAGTSLNQTIVTILDGATNGERKSSEKLSLREAERRRLRAALGDHLADLDVDSLLSLVPHAVPVSSHEELQRMMPKLDPPLSRTIIEDREDRF